MIVPLDLWNVKESRSEHEEQLDARAVESVR